MSENKPEFDALSSSCEDLLRDPIRDRFGAGGSEFFHVRKRDLIREYFRGRGVQSFSFSFLRASETRSLLRTAGFHIDDQRYFLYFPERIYRKLAGVESALRSLPMGGQYAVFPTREELAGS